MGTATLSKLFSDTTYSFNSAKALRRLQVLAKNPFDLTDSSQMTADRLTRMVAAGCGFRLLYGTQRVTDEVMEALWALAGESRCLEKMEAMQAGEIVNFIEGFESEKRQVLHTAMRDFFDAPNPAPAAREAREAAWAEYQKLEAFIGELDKTNLFTDLVCIGIGGSELGPKTLYFSLLSHAKKNRRVHFISNVDPDNTAQVLQGLDLKKTLVMSVSKSGTTLETKTNEELVRAWFRKAGLKEQDHFICATGQGSPMDNPRLYRKSFYIWDYVGGRYCGTSMIGGVMLAFAYGMKVYHELLRGAHEMDLLARTSELRTNLPLLAALLGVWNRNLLGYPTVALIPYSQALVRFAAHIQQCDMESNGKHIDRFGRPVQFETGPIIWGEPATNAQHSFFQLIHQGTDVIPLEFIGFREPQYGMDLDVEGTTSQEKLLANLFAQALALATGQSSPNPNREFKGNRPSTILLGKRLDPYSVGGLLAYYEHKVAFQGFLWNINSFDQEGVQLGKVLALRLIDRFADRKRKTAGKPYPLGDALLKQLEHL
jgi:glucose-6-phosphate isomerase